MKIKIIICILVLLFCCSCSSKQVLVTPKDYIGVIYEKSKYYYLYKNVVIISRTSLDSIPSQFYGIQIDAPGVYKIATDKE